MAQHNFSADWEHFFDGLDARIANRQTLEREYNTILRKARGIEYDNATDAACYYYMATVLCYVFCDNNDSQEEDKNWAVDLGKSAIKNASRLLQDDEEFKTMSLVFELLGLVKKIEESSISPNSVLHKIQSINQQCPHIETMENTLIKNEAMREWFNDAYYFVLYLMLASGKTEDDLDLKIEYALELKKGPTEYDKIVAYASLADACFDKGDFSEAQRYAILGKDILGSLAEYDNDDSAHFYWGICWCIYARCQEEAGDMDFAITLIEKGAALGIPWCVKEKERLKNEGLYGNNEEERNHEEVNSNVGVQLASNEQEYLDALKESFDDGFISPRERKIIDRLRISLGISEERARELEDSLQAQLTNDEQEYLDAFKDASENGVVSDRSRRILERLRVMYGISEERAREIEKL